MVNIFPTEIFSSQFFWGRGFEALRETVQSISVPVIQVLVFMSLLFAVAST
jgi:hypothetical protein